MKRKINIILSICFISLLALGLNSNDFREITTEKGMLNNVETTALYANGDTFNDGVLNYTVISEEDKTVSVDGFVEEDSVESLVIPSIVNNNGVEYTTVKISNKAFALDSALKSVAVSSTVVEIGNQVFGGVDLTSIVFEGNSALTTIGEKAFQTTNLTSITLPSKLENLGVNSFYGCALLKTIYMDFIPSASIISELERLPIDCENLSLITNKENSAELKDIFKDNEDINVTYELTLTLDLNGGESTTTSIEMLQGQFGYVKNNATGAWENDLLFRLPVPTKDNERFSGYTNNDNTLVVNNDGSVIDTDYFNTLTEDTTITAQYDTKSLSFFGDYNVTVTLDGNDYFQYDNELVVSEGSLSNFSSQLLTSDIVFDILNINTKNNVTLDGSKYVVRVNMILNTNDTYKIYMNGVTLDSSNYSYDNDGLTLTVDTLGEFCVVSEGMFSFDNNEIALNPNYNGDITNIVIPDSIDIHGTSYTVEVIAEEGFNLSTIESIVLPNTITTIKELAFNNVIFTTFTVPATVTTIGDNAFGVNSTTNIIMEAELTATNTQTLIDSTSIVIVTKTIYDNSVIDLSNTNIHYVIEVTFNALENGTIDGNNTLVILNGTTNTHYNNGLWSVGDEVVLPTVTSNTNFKFIQYELSDGTVVEDGYVFDGETSFEVFAKYTTNIFEFDDVTVEKEWFEYGEVITLDNNVNKDYLLTSDIFVYGFTLNTNLLTKSTTETYLINITINLDSKETYKLYFNQEVVNYNYNNGIITFETNSLGSIVLVKEGVFFFDVATNEISLNTSYKGDISNIVIPSKFTYNEVEYDVTKIANAGFSFNEINTVVIAESIVVIGERAFEQSSISTITIPSNVTTIGQGAFASLDNSIIYMNAVLTDSNTDALAENDNVVIVSKDNYKKDSGINKLTYVMTTTLDLNGGTINDSLNNVVIKRLFGLNNFIYDESTNSWASGNVTFPTPTKDANSKFSHYELDGEKVTVDTLFENDVTLNAIYQTNKLEVLGDVNATVSTDSWFDLGFNITINSTETNKYNSYLSENDVLVGAYTVVTVVRSNGVYTITITMNDLEAKANYQVFVVNGNKLTTIETTKDGNTLTFTTTELEDFAVVKVAKVYFWTNFTNFEWTLVIVIASLVLYNILMFVLVGIFKKKSKKAKELKMSSTLLPLLMIAVNPLLILIIAAYLLGALALIQTVRVIYYACKSRNKKDEEKVKKEKTKKVKEVKEEKVETIKTTDNEEIKKIDETDLKKVIEENQTLKPVESLKKDESPVENLPLKEVETVLKEVVKEQTTEEKVETVEEVKEESPVNEEKQKEEEVDDSVEIVESLMADEREMLSVNDFDDVEDDETEEDEKEVEEDPTELVKAKKDEEGRMIIIRYKKSYSAKLNLSDDVTKDIHNLIKNKLLSYKKVKSRVSWNYDAFNLGRAQAAKLSVRGKSLFLYLPIDPKEYEGSKYTFKDCSDIKKYEQLPFRIKLKSSRSIKHACELIDMSMTDLETKEIKEFENVNYYQKNRGFDKLLEEGLIKEVIDAETFKDLTEINKEFLDSNNIKSIDLEVIKDIKISDSVYKEVVNNISSKGSARDVINVDTISKAYNDGEVVSVKSLKERKLIPANSKGVKCLARGTLDKCLTFELQSYSKDAIKMILITNGKIQ